MQKKPFLLLSLFIISFFLLSMMNKTREDEPSPESGKESFDSLDLKIAQMIMIGIKGRTSVAENDTLLREIRENKLGGVVLFEKNISPTDSRGATY